MTLRIYTDASYKNNISTHNWRVVNEKGKVIKRRTFKGADINKHSTDAELTTIISALRWIEKKGLRKVTIFTDSKNTADAINSDSDLDSIKYVQWALKGSKVKVKWRTRNHHFIKQCDKSCKQLMKTVSKRVQYAI